MEFLVLLEKKEKQACWGPIQAKKGALVYQVGISASLTLNAHFQEQNLLLLT